MEKYSFAQYLKRYKFWMMKRLIAIGIFLIAVVCGGGVSNAQDTSEDLRNRLDHALSTKIIGTEPFYRPEQVKAFYNATEFEPAWSTTVDASMLMAVVQFAVDEGLNPDDYHLQAWRRYALESEISLHDKVTVDILLTDAFMHFGTHLLSGKIDPSTLYFSMWESDKRTVDLVFLLQQALREKSIVKTLDNLRPNYPHYQSLRQALRHFRSLASTYEWPKIEGEITVEPGMADERIVSIRQRLAITGHYTPDDFRDSTHYDSVLVMAMQKFQQDYGLEPDGIIGKRTLAALNASPETLIQKIVINMERYRWLPEVPRDEYVSVTIPFFKMDVMKRDSVVMTMKAIVGKPERKTPVFNSDIHYLILNPTWTVPPTILRQDVLPAVKQNIGYLKRNKLRVINKKGEEIDPADLPWASYTHRNFPYQLRQDPGIGNSLGLIKFQFPSNHTIFLHDTNLPSLFSRNYRALSSGCIRIDHPFQLTSYIIRETAWSDEQVAKVINSGKTQTIILPKYVPIQIIYITVLVNKNNNVQFAEDIYGWDEVLIRSFF
jgi:L,D-transpeptidase YcbB